MHRRTSSLLLLSLGLLLPALAASGGPDSYGYYYADSDATGGIAYSSSLFDTVVASGTALTTAGGTNDSSESVTLPFTFSLYGTSYTSLYVCANGYMSPTSTCTSSNTALSSNSQVMLAPFWDDLDMSDSDADVYSYTSGASPNRIFTVAFIDAEHDDYDGEITFAIQLYETSNLIVFQYQDVNADDDWDDGGTATVGIDGGSTSGYYTQLSSNSDSYLENSLAVAFSTTRAPIAEANGPYTATEGVATTISGANSVGVFGSITDYAYDCTTDGVYDTSGTSASGTCTYADNGTYTATVRITNSTGVTATDTAAVTVSNAAPTPTAVGVTSGYYSSVTSTVGSLTYYTIYAYEGTTITQTGSATDVAADTVTIHYDWGDGTVGTSNSGSTTSHAFADSGSYDPAVYAKDEDGGTSADMWNYLGYGLLFEITNVAPTITASSATSSTESTSSTFTATATDPGTADVLTYTWSFGDGTSGTGSSTTHQYADDGTYSWTLTVTDGDGGTATSSGTVTVTNALPTISSASFGSGVEGDTISYSVTATDAGTADTLSYSWNFGDGTSSTSSTSTTTHTYADNASYAVTVTVTDDTGSVTSSGTSVITNANPVIGSGTWPTGGTADVSVSFVASATDAGTADTLTYLWSWGDGTTSTSSSASHTWADNGTYTITLTVTDDDGGVTTSSQLMVIAEGAPVISSMSATTPLVEGSSGTFTVSATDADTITYSWDYGDGSTGSGSSTTHAYAEDGTYTVTATATDPSGANDSQTSTVTVTNANPVIGSGTWPTTGSEGVSVSFVGVATDPGSFDTLTYAWSWGDGETSTGASASHTWATEGSYTVTLTVTDDDGGTVSTSQTMVIANVAPVIGSISATSPLAEGETATFTGTATDVAGDTLTYTWDYGDGTTGTGDSSTHAYADNGSYTVTLTVTDDSGATDVSTTTLTVSNADPVIGSGSWPTTGAEDIAVDFVGVATDAGTTDTLTYTWNWGDGTTSTGATASHTWAEDGAYTVTLTVTDDDGGSTTTTQEMVISNVAPVITSITATTPLIEGDTGAFAGMATDVATDTITYTWEYGDGATGTGAETTHIYTDDGTFTVTLTATDDGGLLSTATTTVEVTNAAPVASLVTTLDGNEGDELEVSGVGADVGAGDTLTYTWDFGDGTTGEGNPATHIWEDEGSYIVTMTVTDDDGASDSETGGVTIENLDPTITSDAILTATEGTLYEYAATASDPGLADLFTWSVSGPDGMVVDAATGVLSWTPTYTDSLSLVDVNLMVEDGDGGFALQEFVIEVIALDSDGDGLADGWELLNGLDPSDTTDADADADADGVSNIDEYLAGTDLNTYDGPDAPTPYAPIDSAIVSILTPDLVVDNASSPRGLALTYDYEVYLDEAATILGAAGSGVAESPDQTAWTVNLDLPEEAMAYWRARADDGLVDGPWSDLASFYVTTDEDAPTIPVPVSPIDDVVVTTLSPDYVWTIATDPAGGPVTYDVRVMDETMAVVVDETTGVTDDAADAYANWTTTASLTDGTVYAWEVRAVTDAGVQGGWSDPGYFMVDTTNLAPSTVTWLDPVDGDVLEDVSPSLSWSVSTDPEGTAVTYTVQDDVDAAFTAPSEWTVDVNALDLAAEGASLVENTVNWLRVRGTDGDGISGEWSTIEVFVRGPNDAPAVPVLVSPWDESEDPAPTFTCLEVSDPEGDTVTYQIVVSMNEDLSDPVATGADLLAIDGVVSWELTAELAAGSYFWSANAIDDSGLAGEWAEPWSFEVTDSGTGETGETGETGVADTDTGTYDSPGLVDSDTFGVKSGDCGCASASDNTSLAAASLGLVGMILIRRRRRSGQA